MIVKFLIRRDRRERWMLALAGLALVAVACWTAVIGPAREAVADHQSRLTMTQTNLNLQQRQLTLLRAETAASRRSLEELAGASAPWVAPDEAGALIQTWQNVAAEVGVTIESIARDQQTPIRIEDETLPVSLLLVRLEARGPYGNVMALLHRLTEVAGAVGIEELQMETSDQRPFDLKVVFVLRLAVSQSMGTRSGEGGTDEGV